MGIFNSTLKREAKLINFVWKNEYFQVVRLLEHRPFSIINTQRYFKNVDLFSMLETDNVYRNICKNTPLMIASVKGYYRIAEYLIEKKANINLINEDEYTASRLALRCNNYDIYRLLLDNGAKLDNIDKSGRNIFHDLSVFQDFKFSKFTISNFGDRKLKEDLINNMDYEGNTPLCLSILLGTRDISILYAENGADPCLKNRNGKSPLDLTDDLKLKEELINKYEKYKEIFVLKY